MGLTNTIDIAYSGLRATQAGLDVVSQNVANAGTVGYTRRTLDQEQLVAGGRTIGVDVKGASRVLDTLVQRQLRLEQAGASYAATRAAAHTSLDQIFDQPGGTGSLSSLLGTFTGKLQTLVNNPSSYTTQSEVLSSASALAGSLNSLSGQVGAMRQDAEDALGAAVTQANGLIKQIAAFNERAGPNPSAALEDQRDTLIDQLSTLLDVRVTKLPGGSVTVGTTGGLQLVDGPRATTLSFDARRIDASSVYSLDPAKRTVGTVTATGPDGVPRDVLGAGLIRSGQIAAQIELRDRTLPQAQAQLDGLAAGLAASLSDRTVSGTPATSGTASGFDLDLGSLSAGNPVTVSVKDPGGATRTLTFVKATSADGVAAAQASGQVAIDVSGGYGAVASQIGAALGTNYAVTNPAGSTLRVLGHGSTSSVAALTASATVTGLGSGDPEIPLFVDGGRANAVFSGSFEAGSQLTGFAGRIAVNPAVVADRGSLVSYGPSVPSGDTTRPSLILDRLTSTSRQFSGAAGIGGSNAPWTGTVASFAQQIVATQAADANAATGLSDGQKVVLNAVQARFSDQSGVNMDTELTQLIQLQTAYGANARMISAAKDMMDLLLRIGA